jgi:radical SAM-linked protein
MRLRITFAKQGALRYTSTLDLHKIWERTARRADLPLAYSQGFHPQPKIQLAAALPLGFASRCEVADLWIKEELPLAGLAERIQAATPPGLQILSLETVDERAPALQTLLESAEYEVTVLGPADLDELTRQLDALMEAEALPRERRGKRYDLRPLIEDLATVQLPPNPDFGGEKAEGGTRLWMRLAARQGATGRPDEVLAELGIPVEDARIERTRLLFKEPLTAGRG